MKRYQQKFKALLLVAIIAVAVMQRVKAQSYYQITPNGKKALNAIFDMRIRDAERDLQTELKQHPNNHYTYYLLHYCDVYKVMFNPSEKAFDAFEKNEEKRRAVMNNNQDTSLMYRTIRAEMQLHQGILKIKFGEKFTGLRYAYGAYNKIYDLLEKYPGDAPLLKLDGMFNVAISNLPPFVQFAVSLFGVSGNYKVGLQIMKTYVEKVKKEEAFNTEAALFTIFANKLNKTPQQGYAFVNRLPDSLTKIKLLAYFKINLAYRTGHNEKALQLMQQFDRQTIQSPFPFYDYLMGKILLRKLDARSIGYFERFLKETGSKDYLKEIHYKLALAFLLQGNQSLFEKNRTLACDKGDDITERDRETVYDCSLDYDPNPNLLRAKLLLSGGYLKAADSVLQQVSVSQQEFRPYRLQYHLLMGDDLLLTKDTTKAIVFFNKVLKEGADADYPFASEAALSLGKIYENRNPDRARFYFEKTRELYNSDFYEYIDDAAKKRLEGGV